MSDGRFKPLTLDGRLAHVVEECGEVIAAAGKTQRFGFASVNPLLPPEQQERNADWLWREMDDLQEAIAALKNGLLQAGIVRAKRTALIPADGEPS